MRAWLVESTGSGHGNCEREVSRTDRGVCKDDKRVHVVEPFDPEPALFVLPLLEYELEVARLETARKHKTVDYQRVKKMVEYSASSW